MFVYGNATLGTNDFCIMKYEAKNVGGVATSQAAGIPWDRMSQAGAIAKSAASCSGCHLVTEAEWMTIAADVLTVKYNWSGGAVGKGSMYQGYVNAYNPPNVFTQLEASEDDNDALYGIMGDIGTTSGKNSSRVLYLKSGDAIWDLTGNLLEWTTGGVNPINQVGLSGDTTTMMREWTTPGLSFGNLPTSSLPSALESVSGLQGISGWNSSKGIGKLGADYSATDSRSFLRGGGYQWPDTSGVLMIIAVPGAQNYIDFGFRVAK